MKTQNSDLIKKRKTQILTAALTAFGNRGFKDTTIAEIARLAGVAEGTIYNYYKNKRELMISLVNQYFISQRLFVNTGKLLLSTDSLKFQKIVQERLRANFENANLLFLFLAEVQHNKKIRVKYARQVTDPIFQSLETLLLSGIKQRKFRKVNILLIERVLVSIFIGLSIIYNLENDSGPLHQMKISDISNEIFTLFLNGIAGPDHITKQMRTRGRKYVEQYSQI